MGRPAARQNDPVVGVDTHTVLVPAPPGPPVPTPLPHPFSGTLTQGLSTDVTIAGRPAATVSSVATNTTPHLPTPPGTSFVVPPTNRGPVTVGSTSVLINGQGAARMGDPVMSCTEVGGPTSQITAGSAKVLIG